MPQHSISTFVTSTLPLTDVVACPIKSASGRTQIRFLLIGVEYKILNVKTARRLAKRLRRIADSIDLLANGIDGDGL